MNIKKKFDNINCIICGSKKYSSFFHVNNVPVHPYIKSKDQNFSGNLEIIKCSNCGHLFNNLFDENILNQLYSSNIITNTPVSEGMINSVLSLRDWLLNNSMSKVRNVLEIGGGSGALAISFNDFVDNYLMIEPSVSEENKKKINQFSNLKVSTSKFPNFDIESDYDLIICRQVLEHIPNPLIFLRSIYEITSKHTQVYIEIPSANYIVSNKSVIDFHYPHVHYYFEENIKILFAKFNFEVIDIQHLKNGHDFGFLLKKNYEIKNNLSILPYPQAYDNWIVKSAEINKKAKVALYGANAYSQSFLGMFASKLNIINVFDDTQFYQGNFCYHSNQYYPIEIPSSDNINNVDNIIITAYLHDETIQERILNLNFKGIIYTVRSEPERKNSVMKNFFYT